jgi:hypothetical protein
MVKPAMTMLVLYPNGEEKKYRFWPRQSPRAPPGTHPMRAEEEDGTIARGYARHAPPSPLRRPRSGRPTSDGAGTSLRCPVSPSVGARGRFSGVGRALRARLCPPRPAIPHPPPAERPAHLRPRRHEPEMPRFSFRRSQGAFLRGGAGGGGRGGGRPPPPPPVRSARGSARHAPPSPLRRPRSARPTSGGACRCPIWGLRAFTARRGPRSDRCRRRLRP